MSRFSNRRLYLRDISITKSILISFIIILLSTILAIGYITYSSWMNSANNTINKTVNILNEQIINEIDIFVRDVKQLNIVNKGLIENDIIDINSEASREISFVNALNSFNGDEVYSFSYGNEAGEYYGARKNADDIIEIMKNNKETAGHSWYYSVAEDKTAGELALDAGEFDPRTRAWYKVAKQTDGVVFSPIYKHFVLDDLTVSSSVAISDKNGEIQGVLSTHINLSRINNYLQEITKAENALAIIVEKESGELIANSLNLKNFKTIGNGDFERLTVNEIDHEAIQQAYNNYISSDIDNYKIDYENDQFHIKLIDYDDEGLDWLIITGVPNSMLVGSIYNNIKISLVVTFLAVFISVILFLRLTKRYIDPINSLIQAQEEFTNGDLSKRAIVVRNDEIGMVADSFNTMADTIYELVNKLEEKVEARTLELNKSNQALFENKNQLQLILDSTVESIYGIDINGNCTFINASGVDILGYDDQSELIGENMHFQIHHSYRNGASIPIDECSIFKALTKEQGTYVNDEVFWKKDGTSFNVEYNSYPQLLDGEIVGAVVTFVDNTERKQMEQMIFNEKEQFRTTLLSVGDGVISTDDQGLIKVMNPIAEKLTGWSTQEAYGKPVEEVLVVINEATNEILESAARQVLKSGKLIETTNYTTLISKNKTMIPIEDNVAPILDRDGNVSGVVIVIRDVTGKKEKLEKIEYLSMHDYLTGLYNRWYMEAAMRRLDKEENLPLTIMVIDVNGLKLVNDAFGHKMGDKLLKVVSKVLKNVVRAEDILGRVGGDEFLILFPETDKIEAEKIKTRIIKALSYEKLDSIIISVAIGYSVKNNMDENLETIRISADNQMYKDKLVYGKTMRNETFEKVLRNINFKYDQEQIHTERVSQYCESIARAMNFSEKEIQDIKTAGTLHDIGKIVVPPELLNKTGELTDEECELIKRHSEAGYHILKSVDDYAVLAEDVLYHHENWDGSGYPQGLKGEEIPLNSRIIAVADAYEAMTAKRAYQKTKTKEEAIAELKKCAGKQFDPNIVEIFIEQVLCN